MVTFKEGDIVRLIGYYSNAKGKLYKPEDNYYSSVMPEWFKKIIESRQTYKIKTIKSDETYPIVLDWEHQDWNLNPKEIEIAKINWREVLE